MNRVIIPKRHITVARCITAMLNTPRRRIFQSELKRIAHSNKSWRNVVKREFELWNTLIGEEFPGHWLILTEQMRNPRTRRTNEVLYFVNPDIKVLDKANHFVALIPRGEPDG